MLAPTRSERIAPWLLRVIWIVVLLVGGRAVDGAAPGSELITWLALGGWIVGVATMAIPAVASLTATRALVPLTIPVAAVTWIAGADPATGVVFVGVAVLATVVAGSSPVGRAFVQASAYGDEDRHLLRPPIVFAMLAGGLWLVWA